MSYDATDRIEKGANNTGTYSHDLLGRQTLIPAIDTPAGTDAGDLSLGYYDTDAAHTITQGAVITTYQLDPMARRSSSNTTGSAATDTVRHYTDTSDNPAWADATANGTTSTSRYVGSIGGDLSATITADVVSLPISDLHGDIVTTLAISGDSFTPGVTSAYNEFGDPITDRADTGALQYGWLGNRERALDASGLTLMGARIYNPRTASFTSIDPVAGGNTTCYAYPQDPINRFDLDGKKWNWRKIGKWAAIGAGVAGAVACGMSVVCAIGVGAAAGAASYASQHAGTRKFRWGGLAGAAGLGALGGVGRFKAGASVGRAMWGSHRMGFASRAFGHSRNTGIQGRYNVGRIRTGWGFHNGHNVFRTSWSKPGQRVGRKHIDWGWHRGE